MANYKDRLQNPSSNGDPTFAAAMGAAYDEDTFKKARVSDHSSGAFEVPKIENGNYFARLTNATAHFLEKTDRAGKKYQQPYVKINFKIVQGEYKGKAPSSWFNLGGQTAEQKEKRLNTVLGQLQALGVDTAALEFKDFPRICQQLSDPKAENGRPLVEINVVNRKGNDDRIWQTSYIRKVVTAEAIGLEDDYDEPTA